MILLRSIVFTTLMFLSIPPYGLLVILVRVFGSDASYAMAHQWVNVMLWLCRTICGLSYTVEGRENLPDEPCVTMIKHSSTYETLVTLKLFPRQVWVAKRQLVWAPFFGWALATVDPIAIDRGARGAAVQQVIDQGRERLSRGLWVTIFPEGTRMAAGETRRYGISGTVLAQEAGVKLVPVAHNAGYYWKRRGLRKNPGVVQFVIGEPVDPSNRDPREVNAEIQAWVESTVAELVADSSA